MAKQTLAGDRGRSRGGCGVAKPGKALYALILTAFLLCESTTATTKTCDKEAPPTYTAAVVEYSPALGVTEENIAERFQENLNNYKEYITIAKKEGADIVVFPECGLATLELPLLADNTPAASVDISHIDSNPCVEKDFFHSPTMRELSCAARGAGIYVVVNLPEREHCSPAMAFCPECPGFDASMTEGQVACNVNGFRYFNTNVAFDRKGTLVARYRKYNLFGEPGFVAPATAELSTFETDFGVRFGIFTCFDLMFDKPAVELVAGLGITDLVFPTAWFSELPFLTAVQAQTAWSWVLDVNLLASGYNLPSVGSTGSGLYAGRRGVVAATMERMRVSKMLVGELPNARSCKAVTQATLPGRELELAGPHDDGETVFARRVPSGMSTIDCIKALPPKKVTIPSLYKCHLKTMLQLKEGRHMVRADTGEAADDDSTPHQYSSPFDTDSPFNEDEERRLDEAELREVIKPRLDGDEKLIYGPRYRKFIEDSMLRGMPRLRQKSKERDENNPEYEFIGQNNIGVRSSKAQEQKTMAKSKAIENEKRRLTMKTEKAADEKVPTDEAPSIEEIAETMLSGMQETGVGGEHLSGVIETYKEEEEKAKLAAMPQPSIDEMEGVLVGAIREGSANMTAEGDILDDVMLDVHEADQREKAEKRFVLERCQRILSEMSDEQEEDGLDVSDDQTQGLPVLHDIEELGAQESGNEMLFGEKIPADNVEDKNMEVIQEQDQGNKDKESVDSENIQELDTSGTSKDEPAGIAKEHAGINKLPSGTAEESASTVDEPIGIAEESADKAEEPAGKAEEPVEIAVEHAEVAEESAEIVAQMQLDENPLPTSEETHDSEPDTLVPQGDSPSSEEELVPKIGNEDPHNLEHESRDADTLEPLAKDDNLSSLEELAAQKEEVPIARKKAAPKPIAQDVFNTKSSEEYLYLKTEDLSKYATLLLTSERLIENSTLRVCHGLFCCHFTVALNIAELPTMTGFKTSTLQGARYSTYLKNDEGSYAYDMERYVPEREHDEYLNLVQLYPRHNLRRSYLVEKDDDTNEENEGDEEDDEDDDGDDEDDSDVEMSEMIPAEDDDEDETDVTAELEEGPVFLQSSVLQTMQAGDSHPGASALTMEDMEPSEKIIQEEKKVKEREQKALSDGTVQPPPIPTIPGQEPSEEKAASDETKGVDKEEKPVEDHTAGEEAVKDNAEHVAADEPLEVPDEQHAEEPSKEHAKDPAKEPTDEHLDGLTGKPTHESDEEAADESEEEEAHNESEEEVADESAEEPSVEEGEESLDDEEESVPKSGRLGGQCKCVGCEGRSDDEDDEDLEGESEGYATDGTRKTRVMKKMEPPKRYYYRLAVFSGLRSFDGVTDGGLQVCAVIACTDMNVQSCGKLHGGEDTLTPTTFTQVSINGRFRKKHALPMPSTVGTDMLPLPAKSIALKVTSLHGDEADVTLKTTQETTFLTFGIYSRNFEQDPPKPESKG